VAGNIAVLLPAGTVTDAGIVNTAELSLRVTAAPPAGAACVSATVQVVLSFAGRLVAAHSTADTLSATSDKLAVCVEPFRAAVIVAV
jgi:hypothetical protein